MTKPLVSIIVPVLNLEKHQRVNQFTRLIASIQEQTYERGQIELVVVDGDSHDATLGIVRSLAEQGIVNRYRSQRDTGIYQAINRGIAMSSGELVGVASSDDFYTLNAIEDVVTAFSTSAADYVHGLTPYLLASGEVWYIAGQVYSWNQVYFGMPIGHQSLFVRRKLFEQIGVYPEQFRVIGDFLFVRKLHMKQIRRRSIDTVLCHFHHRDGVSSRDQTMFSEFASAYRAFCSELDIRYEEFLLFLALSNKYLASHITDQVLDRQLFESALASMYSCRNRELVIDFQRCALFCLFRANRFSERHADESKIQVARSHRPICNTLGGDVIEILEHYPFINRDANGWLVLDRALQSLQAVDDQTSVFNLQQAMLRRAYACLVVPNGTH